MKVLIVNPEFYVYGGAERVIVRLANYLTDKSVMNTIITPRMLPKIKRELMETRVIETETIEKLVPVLHGILHKFDVINLHNDPAQVTVFPRQRPTVWLCNEPPIQTFTGGELSEQQREIVRKHIDIAVVADEYNRERFKKIYGMDARVNPYGVEFDFFAEGNRDAAIEKWNLDGHFVILQVGMFTFTKNQLKTVSIFKKVKKRIPEAKLVLAGFDKTPYKNTVMRRIRSDRLRKDVVLTGEITQTEIRDLYHACDVMVAPIMAQGGWLSTFEAMAAGKPVVVSKEMTAASIIEENKLGIVTDDYLTNIIGIYENGFDGYNSQVWVKENLSWDKFCKNMLGFFEEVME